MRLTGVEYIHLYEMNPAFSNTSTPDWLLHLAAEHGGLEGVVTTDPSQLDQDEEAVALTATRLSLVTWKSRIDDPVVLWGSLIAFMPRLTSGRVESTAGIGGRVARDRGMSLPELRAEVLPDMRAELSERGLEHLGAYLDRERPPRS